MFKEVIKKITSLNYLFLDRSDEYEKIFIARKYYTITNNRV